MHDDTRVPIPVPPAPTPHRCPSHFLRHHPGWAAWLPLLVLPFLACSGTSQVIEPGEDAPGNDASTVDAAADVLLPGEIREPEASAEIEPWDLQAEVEPACQAGKGCFLDPCNESADCLSGWCVEHMGEGVCSQTCEDECPAGWTCEQVSAALPDVVFICVSRFANLCRPCNGGSDCVGTGGTEDACVAYGDEGSFCGGPCDLAGATSSQCPWGFTCKEVLTTDGIPVQQCVADAGVCPCTKKSVELGLWTACSIQGQHGECAGKRVCTKDGLMPCDAPTPSPDECDGLDNDCDGGTDEGTCDDGNSCTQDSCAGASGCEHLPLEGGECKDNNPCTVADHCEAGVCIGDPVFCNDENPCTDDLCSENGGCTYVTNLASCDDGNPCTVADACLDGTCSGYLLPCDCQDDDDCLPLDDGDACNGTLFCDTSKLPFACAVEPGSLVDCAPPTGPDAPCLLPSCNPSDGKCSFVAGPDFAPCDDGDSCTLGDACSAGKCLAGPLANCNDGNPCTNDACAPGSGCVNTPNALPCSDLDACTVGDVCQDGKCVSGTPATCDDGNSCTLDQCVPATGCAHSPVSGNCDDGNACTESDLCDATVCKPGKPVTCNDGNLCTDDSCSPATGCAYTLNSNPCDDGDLCTTGDFCHLGMCTGGKNLLCDDGNSCTDDGCTKGVGCFHKANTAPCNDGNACTLQDACSAGWCKGGKMLPCDDANPCTDDSCDPVTGCLHVPNNIACDDGDLCTVSDKCLAGACKAGPPATCDDAQFCNGSETCLPAKGCQPGLPPDLDDKLACTQDLCDEKADAVLHLPQDALCDDKLFCNGTEACAPLEGGCKAGTEPLLDDGNTCTADSCDEQADKVVHNPIGAPPVPGAVSGPVQVNSGQSGVQYSVQPVPGAASYDWTLPQGAAVTAGAGTAAITVTFGNTAGQVCAASLGPCGKSQPTCISVSIAASEKRAFITSLKYNGNLGGLAGADAKCQARADAASLGGTWKAWLSDSKTSAASRLTHSPLPYRLLNGSVLANNWADLTSGSIKVEFRISETGQPVPYHPGGGTGGCSWVGGMFFFPWTATANDGAIWAPAGTCSDWTSTGGSAGVGLGGYSLSQWTQWCQNFPCTWENHLHCLEQ